jgi:hypothetical protein
VDAAFAGDKVVGSVGVRFVTVWALELTGGNTSLKRVCALAGHWFTPLQGKAL